MKNRKWGTAIASAAGLLVLILDSRTGLAAAREGITLCISTLIPSMFPFFILSMVLTSSLAGQSIKLLVPFCKLCRMPPGAESLLAIGLLGGYPVGAQNVLASCQLGLIPQDDARRMAVFCNNAGPAFLFGYLGTLFDEPIYPWLIWGIHIAGALFLGSVLPGGSYAFSDLPASKPLALSQAFHRSLQVMAQVCGWVILFRVLLGFLERWFFWMVPENTVIFLSGLLELSNGCMMLSKLSSNGSRMILASTFLGFGGICVLMQTQSIAGSFKIPMYLPGKAIQGCVSFLLAYFIQFFIPGANPVTFSPLIVLSVFLVAAVLMYILRKQEKPVAISRILLYNQASCEKRRTICSSGKKSKNPAPTAPSAPN